MTALRTPILNSSRLTYLPDRRTFAADESDLGDYLGRAYDDACDVGFTLRSSRTGREVRFIQTDTVKRDGDVLYDVYEPTNHLERSTLRVKVQIFND